MRLIAEHRYVCRNGSITTPLQYQDVYLYDENGGYDYNPYDYASGHLVYGPNDEHPYDLMYEFTPL